MGRSTAPSDDDKMTGIGSDGNIGAEVGFDDDKSGGIGSDGNIGVEVGSDRPTNDPPAAEGESGTEPNGDKTDKRDHRQWIIDRVLGQSKVGDDHPPLRCCTVPPCVACCPGVLEQNCVCEKIGRIGVVRPNDSFGRRWLMRIGLVTQVVGMVLTVVSCLAISTHYDLLSNVGFTKGVVAGRNMSDIEIFVGLRAIAVNNPNPGRVGKVVITFEEFCSLTPDESRTVGRETHFDAATLSTYLNPRDCGECAAVSGGMVASLIMSVVTYLPTIFTDVLRMYPNYDVNCQKTFGFVVAFFGLCMAINTWIKYDHNCVNNFYDGLVPHDASGAVLLNANADDATASYDIGWWEGAGLICLITATFLKVVDIVCHFLLPTPSITRDYAEQAQYEKLCQKEDLAAEEEEVEAV